MNHSCVVRAHGAGLFSNIGKVLTCLRIYDHVHVDWSKAGENDPAFKFGGNFYGDCWDTLFEFNDPLPEEPYDTIHQYPFYEITDACAGTLYRHPEWGWRERYNKVWEKLECKLNLVPVPPDTLGVMIRSDVHGGEQLSGQGHTLERYAETIDKTPHTNLFVVSSDEESISWMIGRYPNLFFTKGIKRSAKRSDPEQHITVPQTKEDAVAVVQEILNLSTCKALIHPVSNMATAALYMNLELESVYLR